MTIEVRPAAEFEAVRTMLGPKNGTSPVCFCLSHRIPAKLNRELVEPERSAYVRDLCASDPAPGVLAFDGDTVVGFHAMFEKAGFEKAADTASTYAGFPRVVMRLGCPFSRKLAGTEQSHPPNHAASCSPERDDLSHESWQ